MGKMGKHNHIQRGEDGLVAIVVATVIMVILSLITLGFARIMQSEQRQALDRSLSTQAFYAAESAVNDVVRQIQDPNPATAFTQDKNTCGTDPSNRFTGEVDTNLSAAYTCLRVDQAPETLEYTQGSIGTDVSKIVPVRADTGVPINRINISWEEDSSSVQSGNAAFPACPGNPASLPPFSGAGAWDRRIGMIRADIIPADTLNRDALVNSTMSLYLYPCAGGGTNSINYSAHNDTVEKGQIVAVRCVAGGTPRDCDLAINMDISPNRLYYLRLRSIYKASDLTVRVFDAASNQLAIRGAQVQIDATGKVNDVLRRIQVRVPVNRAYQVPEFVIQTNDNICKQLQVTPNPTPYTENPCGL
jgi:Tfp pilus assembly protein PilX